MKTFLIILLSVAATGCVGHDLNAYQACLTMLDLYCECGDGGVEEPGDNRYCEEDAGDLYCLKYSPKACEGETYDTRACEQYQNYRDWENHEGFDSYLDYYAAHTNCYNASLNKYCEEYQQNVGQAYEEYEECIDGRR